MCDDYDICDTCDCWLGFGRGVGCKHIDCQCKCHHWDARTAFQIITTHKRAKPTLDVAPLAGMHRNKIFAYLVDNMTSEEMTRAFELNSRQEGEDGPAVRSDWVPLNIAEMTAKASGSTRRSSASTANTRPNLLTRARNLVRKRKMPAGSQKRKLA